ncbi:MAG: hypothetical protein JXO44_03675 [Clostridia bacterium]|nr:hypothetical protein [Clostridia bacterium]
MADCPNLAGCAFVGYCNENDACTSVNGFIKIYCKSEKQNQCIRKRLCDQFGKVVVPKNMMPNGAPIPGTSTDDWSHEAKNHRKVL